MFKITSYVLILILLVVAILLSINKELISESYQIHKNGSILFKIAIETEKAHESYLNDTPEKAIEALLQLKNKLKYELKNFDDTNEWKFIERSTIIGDLSLAYGRLSIKYLELNDSVRYKENINKALFYFNQYHKSS